MSTTVTLTGRLGADPELKFAASGMAILNARVVTSWKRKNAETGKWEDVDTTWWRVTAFRELAENAAESLSKGDEVIVVGKVKQNNYETAEGEKRSSMEVTAEHIGPSLRRASAQVRRVSREAGEGRAQYEQAKQQLDDPWAVDPTSMETPF